MYTQEGHQQLKVGLKPTSNYFNISTENSTVVMTKQANTKPWLVKVSTKLWAYGLIEGHALW